MSSQNDASREFEGFPRCRRRLRVLASIRTDNNAMSKKYSDRRQGSKFEDKFVVSRLEVLATPDVDSSHLDRSIVDARVFPAEWNPRL